jgi:hypothetical protein
LEIGFLTVLGDEFHFVVDMFFVEERIGHDSSPEIILDLGLGVTH